MIVGAAESCGIDSGSPQMAKRPERSKELLRLLDERRRCQDRHRRTQLSKGISKLSRRELRAWRLLWSEHLLRKFRNTKYLQKIMIGPVHGKAYPVEDADFANLYRVSLRPNRSHDAFQVELH